MMYHFCEKLKIFIYMKALKSTNIRLLIIALITMTSLYGCDDTESPQQGTDNPQTEDKSLVDASSHSNESDTEPNTTASHEKLPKESFKTIEWIDLMPKDDLEALLNPPEYLADIEDGSAEDQISSQIRSEYSETSDDRYQQALVSTDVVAEMDGKAITLPGFIVPIEFSDDQTVTQFFLVPFFGACIHVPPPPPNQVIFVDYPEGIKLEALYDPFWLSGILQTSVFENSIAKSTYTLNLQYYEKYTE